MKNFFTCLCLITVVLVIYIGNAKSYTTNIEDESAVEMKKLATVLINTYPSDVIIRLGIVEAYPTVVEQSISFDALADYHEVLRLNKMNLPANAMVSIDKCSSLLFKMRDCNEELNCMINYYKKYKPDKDFRYTLGPDSSNHLFYILRKGKQQYVEIKDMEESVQEVRKKLGKEYESLLTELRETQQLDIDNALYDYLIAGILMNKGDNASALVELKRGLEKKHCNLYMRDRIQACAVVADKMDIPVYDEWPPNKPKPTSPWRLTKNAMVFGNTSRGYVGLFQVVFKTIVDDGKKCEDAGDYSTAESYYNYVVEVGKQLSREASFINEELDGSIRLQLAGYNALQELYTKEAKEKDKEEVSLKLKCLIDRRKYLKKLKMLPQVDKEGYKRLYLSTPISKSLVVEKGESAMLEAFFEKHPW